MSEEEKNDHVWFRERIAAALAGGLDEAERVHFEAHASECEACAAELRALEQMERHMAELLAVPSAGLDDRIIHSLREARDRWRPRMIIHPAVRRAAVGVAAVILLGGFGYVVSDSLQSARRAPNRSIALYEGEAAGRAANTVGFDDDYDRSVMGSWFKSGEDAGSTRSAGVAGAVAAGQKQVSWDSESQRGRMKIAAGKPVDAKNTEWSQRQNDEGKSVGAEGAANSSAPTALNFSYFGLPGLARKEEEIKNKGIVVRAGREGQDVSSSGVVPLLAAPAQNAPATPAAPVAGVAILGDPVLTVERMAEAKPLVEPAQANRRIIRSGQVEFEVDRFDAAYAQVIKLATEAGGYVSTTDSEKLPNGKVKGVVTLRVPPDRLDTLVTQLRGIGDLKMQKLDANDISKQYTDLESGLMAARAMEERLLAIIKEGKGQIKDLLAAEKELGVWREKIEKTVGEMRYFDNLVSMSTLQVSLFERDIKTPAMAQELETVDAGMESPDVEKARADALKAIEETKGRVIQSDLKRYDAGQFGATIVAEVPPENAGPLLDRLKQIGKIARLDIQRKQTTDPNADSSAPLRVEKKPTRLNLSLYNLANVAPRVNSTINLAADDVEKAYRAILERVKKTEGRIVTSNLATNRPERTTGTISFEVPQADADAVVGDIKALGEVIALGVTENPDVNNVTTAKRGFSISLSASASIPPRQTQALVLEARDVEAAMMNLLQAANEAGGRIIESNVAKDRDGVMRGALSFEAPLGKSSGLVDQAKKEGVIRGMQRSENLQAPSGAVAKARIDLQIGSPDAIVEAGSGPWAMIRNGLSTAARGLLWSLQLIVTGICFVGPFALVFWAGWKLIRRGSKLRRDVGAGAA